MIGVVDSERQKDHRYSYNSKNATCYYGNNGKKFPNTECEGDGFKQGDVVEVDINRATSTIKYSVNGAVKATHAHEMLADNSRVFMPYVEMANANDAVEWVME